MADYRAHLRISGFVSFEDISPEVWEAIRALLEGRGVMGAEPVPAEPEPPKPEPEAAKQEPEPPKPEPAPAAPEREEPVRSRKTAAGLPENIGDVIKRLRHIYRLSAQEFGDLIGYSKSAVEFWEAGRYKPSSDAASVIMRQFELDTLALTEEDFRDLARRRDEIVAEDERRREEARKAGESA